MTSETAEIWRDIEWYRGFYDVPRLFCVRIADGFLVFDCPFNDALDEYPDSFAVYRFEHEPVDPEFPVSRLETARAFDSIPVRIEMFDDTRRHRALIPSRLAEHA